MSDQLFAASGHGGYCPEGVPVEFALLSILAAFGAAFGILYRALTLTTDSRRKRSDSTGDHMLFINAIQDFGWAGGIKMF